MNICERCFKLLKNSAYKCDYCHQAFPGRESMSTGAEDGIEKISYIITGWTRAYFSEDSYVIWKDHIQSTDIKHRKYSAGRVRRVNLIFEKYGK